MKTGGRTSIFLISCAVGFAVLVATDYSLTRLGSRVLQVVRGSDAARRDEFVQVYVFSKSGELVGPVKSARWELTDDEWRQRLTAEQYKVARNRGTERPFCGTLLDNKLVGAYTCICCGLPLFSSDSKYDSGTGWPSFFQPIAPGNVVELQSLTLREFGNEILCARCDAHLGHVFTDGPPPSNMRFCLNSAALAFTLAENYADLADPAAAAQASTPVAQDGAIDGATRKATE